MDEDRVAESAKEIKGTVKQAVGKAVGDAKLGIGGQGRQDRRQGSERHRRPQRHNQRHALREIVVAAMYFVPCDLERQSG